MSEDRPQASGEPAQIPWPQEPGLRPRPAGSPPQPLVPPTPVAQPFAPSSRAQAGTPGSQPAASQSYSEKYRGTQWGQSTEPASPPTPPTSPSAWLPGATPGSAVPQEGGWNALRVIVLIAGVMWILSGVGGLVGLILFGLTRTFGGFEIPAEIAGVLDAVLLVGLLVDLLYIAWGVKIIIAPGPWSLGCTGLLYAFGAFGLLVGISAGIASGGNIAALAVLAVVMVFEAVIGVGTLIASQQTGS